MVHKMRITTIILFIIVAKITFAQEVVGVEMSTCDKNSTPEFMFKNRLINQELINDTLFLRIGIVRNCALEPEVSCNKNSDSLFIHVQNVSDIWEGCICCFELEIKIIGIRDTNFTTYIGNSELKKVVNKYIFPSLAQIESYQEVNQYNSDSLKIGLWNMYDDNEIRIKAKVFYFIDDSGQSRAKWHVLYDNEGQFATICALTWISSDGISNTTCADQKQYLDLKIKEP